MSFAAPSSQWIRVHYLVWWIDHVGCDMASTHCCLLSEVFITLLALALFGEKWDITYDAERFTHIYWPPCRAARPVCSLRALCSPTLLVREVYSYLGAQSAPQSSCSSSAHRTMVLVILDRSISSGLFVIKYHLSIIMLIIAQLIMCHGERTPDHLSPFSIASRMRRVSIHLSIVICGMK